MPQVNLDKLRKAPVVSEPFSYTIVPDFLGAEPLGRVIANYPDCRGGSYPLESLTVSAALRELIDDLDGAAFEQAVEDRFDVLLRGMPKMYSLRGYCRSSDGKIHTDSKDKIITVLLYLNEPWKHDGGRLRLLRSGTDLEDCVDEVPPDNGTLLVFRRSDKSWHGHGPFEGVRRSIQMNWMVSDSRRSLHAIRHKISAGFKKLAPAH